MSDIGYIPTSDFSREAQIRATDWRATARTLHQEMNPKLADYGPGERAYVTPEEATMDLGLSNIHQRAATAGIKAIVKDTRSMLSVSKEFRKLGMETPVIRELLKRGKNLTAELRVRRSYVAKSGKPPEGGGWMPIPKGKSGGYRRHKSGGGYEYAYPDGKGGHTEHSSPAADEHEDVQADHLVAEPKPEVAAKFRELQAKARAAGLTLKSQPSGSTSVAHLRELEKHLDKAIAQHQKRGEKVTEPEVEEAEDTSDDPTEGGEDHADDAADAGEEPGDDSADPEAGKDHNQEDQGASGKGDNEPEAAHDDKALLKLAAAKGIDDLGETLASPEFQSPEGRAALHDYLTDLPDLEDIDEELPEGDDGSELKAYVAKLEATLDALEERLEAAESSKDGAGKQGGQHRAEVERLRGEVERLRRSPGPRKAQGLAAQVWGLAILVAGFGLGMLLGGPILGLMAMTIADKYMKAHGVPGADDAAKLADKAKAAVKGDKAKKPKKPRKLTTFPEKGDNAEDEKPVKKGFQLVSVEGRLLLKSGVEAAFEAIRKGERPEGGGWQHVPGGRKGGYRKPKGGGGWEYWYPDGHRAKEHIYHHRAMADSHDASAADHAKRATDGGPEFFRQLATKESGNADQHREALAAAVAASKRDAKPFSSKQAHAGRRTLGVDEGTVYSVVADVLGPQVLENKNGNSVLNVADKADTIGTTTVALGTVFGHKGAVRVEFRVSDKTGFSGHLETRIQRPLEADGRFDPSKPGRPVPTAIVINCPRSRGRDRDISREEYFAEARRVVAHELAHGLDELSRFYGKSAADHAKYKADGARGGGEHYYNDPAEIVAFRHNMFRELNDPKVHAAIKEHQETWATSKEDADDLREFAKEDREWARENVRPIKAGPGRVSADVVMQMLNDHSPTWARVKPHLNTKNRRKMLEMAASALSAHAEGTSKPVKKGAANPVNEAGHRYDLQPGMTLIPRQGWARDQDPEVIVLKGGEFAWNGETYPNGTQLLKALKRKDRVHITLSRYFRLGDNATQLAKGLAQQLQRRYPDLLILPVGGYVRTSGRDDIDPLLDPAAAMKLLEST